MITISDRLRGDLLVTALEGGSNYWYCLDAEEISNELKRLNIEDTNEPIAIKVWNIIKATGKVDVYDIEAPDEKLGTINLKSIEEGEKIMADKYPQHFKKIIDEDSVDWDAETADVWFQLAVLKELTYG